jgi:hypothetical protein
MAIKETRIKLHFEPYKASKGRIADTEPAPTVAVSRKYNYIAFSRSCVIETEMEGRFVKLYLVPSKKVIGWQTREKLDHSEMKDWKLCKVNKQGQFRLNIKKLLDAMEGTPLKETYKRLPVQKYREVSMLSEHKDEVFYFVELKGGEDNEDSE